MTEPQTIGVWAAIVAVPLLMWWVLFDRHATGGIRGFAVLAPALSIAAWSPMSCTCGRSTRRWDPGAASTAPDADPCGKAPLAAWAFLPIADPPARA
ncbi:hypothetical protein [Microbacterium sp. ZXX196]|uniref:hypothetical protein n=1 Tax=Microbacterium sp. ZXX196 TaxID=2609291 RepID=UPI0012B9E7F8|nr:hypothetical protein [Microbacterium sp. ZXX196]MTE24455.1 hypothetical protein [Microbacterium sp. ZXX196]